MCIKANRYRYSYGRQANRSLRNLSLPATEDIPEWINTLNQAMFAGADVPASVLPVSLRNPITWKSFRYDEIFLIKKGYYNKKPPNSGRNDPSDIPFIGASESNNGRTSFVSLIDLQNYSRDGSKNPDEPLEKKLFPGGAVTVPNNGASVAEAFYQESPFTCTHDVNPLYLKDKEVKMTSSIGLFLATVIRAEKYRWSYGRKWRPIRMPSSIIRLPVTASGKPDWTYMQSYIKSLPFSSQTGE